MSKRDQSIEYPQRRPKYVPVTTEEAAEQIATGFHAGLLQGSDAPSSRPLWRAIDRSEDSAWVDAARHCVSDLEAVGLVICRRIEP